MKRRVGKGKGLPGFRLRNPPSVYDSLNRPRGRMLEELRKRKLGAGISLESKHSRALSEFEAVASQEQRGGLVNHIGSKQLESLLQSAGSGRAVGELVNKAGSRAVCELVGYAGSGAVGELVKSAGSGYAVGELVGYAGSGRAVGKLVKSVGSGYAVGELVKSAGVKLVGVVLRKEKDPEVALKAIRAVIRNKKKKR
ncbi:MAG: hypothetical protein HY393_01050 [Candidatus Diapherotrites archaeon]|nr:hypothetical protein [Candidatus Diapherotrites archaeon]